MTCFKLKWKVLLLTEDRTLGELRRGILDRVLENVREPQANIFEL